MSTLLGSAGKDNTIGVLDNLPTTPIRALDDFNRDCKVECFILNGNILASATKRSSYKLSRLALISFHEKRLSQRDPNVI